MQYKKGCYARVFGVDVERVFETGESLPYQGPHKEIVDVSVVSKNITQLRA
jgi:hypothetical protein